MTTGGVVDGPVDLRLPQQSALSHTECGRPGAALETGSRPARLPQQHPFLSLKIFFATAL